MEKLERTILGQFLGLDNYQKQLDVLMELNLTDFQDELAQSYFALFNKVVFEKRSIVSSALIYQEISKLPNVDVVDFVQMQKDAMYANSLSDNIQHLKERNYKDKIVGIIDKVSDIAKKSFTLAEIEDAKEDMIIRLSSVEIESESTFIDPKPIIEKINENMRKGVQREGHSWGIYDLDAYTSGIVTPRLFVIGGLKKGGKSRFVINTMIELYHNNIPSVFLSLEMPEYEVVKLLLSRYTMIDDIRMRSISNLLSDDKIRIEQAEKDIDWSLLNVECVSSIKLNQLIGRLRKYKRMFPNAVIFIDYLQRIEHDRNRQAQELESISIAIANATREFNLPVILLSQLSNIAEREGISIGALKGSGGIGESADVILLLDNLYRRSKDENDKNKTDIYIEQRYGDSGKISVHSDLGKSFYADLVRTENKF